MCHCQCVLQLQTLPVSPAESNPAVRFPKNTATLVTYNVSLQQLEPTRFRAYKFKPVIAVLQVQNYLLCCTFGVVSCDVHFVYYKQILCVCLAHMHVSKRSLKFSHCVYASFCLKMLFFLNNLTTKSEILNNLTKKK